MTLRRSLSLILAPLLLLLAVIATSWSLSVQNWYFRGYEYYDDWVYTGLSDPNLVMWESGDSSRGYLYDSARSYNSITLNEFGHRIAPCSAPTILGIGDSQLFGSGLDDSSTFPFQIARQGGPCIYNAGRYKTVESFQIPGLMVQTILITSAERDGFKWYCSQPPEDWSFEKKPAEDLILKRVSSPRLVISTAIRRTVSVVRSKAQNFLAMRFVAPSTRIIGFEHRTLSGELEENLACAIRINSVLANKGFNVAFLLFPAAQTLNPTYANHEIDDQTINFIPNLTKELLVAGIKTIDSKRCLETDGNKNVQLHDTHLSSAGMQQLALCVIKSKILEPPNGG